MSAHIEDLLQCPRTGDPMRRTGTEYVSLGDASLRFPIEDGIVRAVVPHEPTADDLTEAIKVFYEKNPFPNYEDTEDVGSLVEKSVARGFPEMLNRSIPPNATVLEVGCGTGQLGNFLSIANRRVLSLDLCLNSLRLAERFREGNGLTGVAFAQMNLFHLPLKPDSFDVVICTGVLHHTADPRRGFLGLVPLIKPGGHVLVGLYNRYGRFKTRCRRALARMFGDRLADLDPYLETYGVTRDKRRAWFMDQYRNPHESLHSVDEVLRWFDEAGISFIRAMPSTVFGSRVSPEYRRSLFDREPVGSRVDRLLCQLQQMVEDTEGGLFVMIGRRHEAP
jgi:SAM-dependent methyltransferase